MFDSESVVSSAKEKVHRIGSHILSVMESYLPDEINERAFVYPASVPKKWTEVDEGFIEEVPDPSKSFRFYVHIPWCRSKCAFCFYDTVVGYPEEAEVEAYFECLRREITLYCKKLGMDRLKVEILYIGGGTPSILSPRQIEKLLALISRNVDFLPGASLIVEASPGTLTFDKVQAFVNGGVNRVSLGVQTFNDHVLRLCKRDHDAQQSHLAFGYLRKASVPEINMDLMLMLPDQSLDSFAQSIDTALKMKPSSISFCDLRVAKGSILYKNEFMLPEWSQRILMRAIYQGIMATDHSYRRTRPHYFILPEEARARSTRVPYLDTRSGFGHQIGIGISAYSHIGRKALKNSSGTKYMNTLRSNRLPIAQGLFLSEQEQTAMLTIRTIIDNMSIPNNEAVESLYKEKINFLIQNRLINSDLQLTEDGCLFGDEIAYMFYL